MDPKTRWKIGAAVLGLVASLLSALDLPLELYPYPIVPTLIRIQVGRVLPFWIGSEAVFLLAVILFLLLSPSLVRGNAQVSWKNLLVLVAASAMEITWHVQTIGAFTGGDDLVGAGAVLWLCALWSLWFLAYKSRSYGKVFAYHFAFALWIMSYAIPWFPSE